MARDRAKTSIDLNWTVDPSIDPFSVWTSDSRGMQPSSSRSPLLNSPPLHPQPTDSLTELVEKLRKELKSKQDDLLMAAEIGQTVLVNYHKTRELVDEKTMELSKLRAELEFKHKQELTDLQRKYHELEKRKSYLESENRDYEQLLIDMRHEMDSLSRRTTPPSALSRSPIMMQKQQQNEQSRMIEVLEQEIEQRKRTEVGLERRLLDTKLKMKSESDELNKANQQLLEELHLLQSQMDALKAENEHLKEITAAESLGKSAESNEQELLSVVKELSEVNEKLAKEKEDLERMLLEARNDLKELEEQAIENNQTLPVDIALGNTEATPIRSPLHADARLSVFGELESAIKGSLAESMRSSMTASPVSPVNLRRQQRNLSSTSRLSTFNNEIPEISPIPSKLTRTAGEMEEVQSRLDILNYILSTTLQRFSNTNTLNLNRRLKKVFDLPSLTQLSNSIIEHISNDIAGIPLRMNQMIQQADGNNLPVREPQTAEESIADLTKTIMNTLTEIAQLRKSCNDLSLAFYDKMKHLSKVEVDKANSDRELKHHLLVSRSEPKIPRASSMHRLAAINNSSLRRSVSQSIKSASNELFGKFKGKSSEIPLNMSELPNRLNREQSLTSSSRNSFVAEYESDDGDTFVTPKPRKYFSRDATLKSPPTTIFHTPVGDNQFSIDYTSSPIQKKNSNVRPVTSVFESRSPSRNLSPSSFRTPYNGQSHRASSRIYKTPSAESLDVSNSRSRDTCFLQ